MLTIKQRLDYLVDSFRRRNEPVFCPSCGSTEARLADRKFVFTRLFECQDCHLNFRHPPESAEDNNEFYQQDYVEGDGITTQLPSINEVEELKRNSFKAYPERSIFRLKPALDHCFPGRPSLRILDYGASWGYMTFQLKELGHVVDGYEISLPRARFGVKALGVTIHTNDSSLSEDYDLFFSSHVIEHVPNPNDVINSARRRVAGDGYCVILCPNGSEPFRAVNPQAFHRLWGKVHPNLLTAAFFSKAFSANPYFIATSADGLNRIQSWDRLCQMRGDDLAGGELFVFARPRMDASSKL